MTFSLDISAALVRATVVALFLLISRVVGKRLLRRSPYKSIPGPPLSSFLGYLIDLHDPNNLNWHFNMTIDYGHIARLRGGFIGKDALYVSDPLALHSILVRDQYVFRESTEFSGLFGVIHHGSGLASVWGNEHKRQRKLMNPVFTASNMSKLVPLFYKISHELKTKLISEFSTGKTEVTLDILDRLTRTALELIAQGGIGHTFNSLEKDSQEFHKFHDALKSVLPNAGRLFLFLPYFDNWRRIEPVWLRRFLSGVVAYLPWKAAREFKAAVDIIHPVCASAFKEKKIAFEEGGIEELSRTKANGVDLTTLLIRANSEADEEDRMPDDIITANMSSIVLGGQETTSGALSRLLSLMASDTDLQSRVREEIIQAKEMHGADLNYEQLDELPLLDAVIRETLRLFAPVTFVWRQTMQDYVVPLHFPIRDPATGENVKELHIKEGTSVYVGIGATNRSPAIWGPDAGEFNPARWLGKQRGDITSEGVKNPGIYSNMLTFLGGGRSCPGMKFATLEIKLVLSVLIPSFSFSQTLEQVDWKMGITLSPYVRGREKEGPQVPMRVMLRRVE